jgi:5-methylcytosine-specific restriction endonuclease McrA
VRYIPPVVNLIPTCAQCGSPVTDSLDPEVEEQGQLKKGKYINSVWMCNECSDAQGSSDNDHADQKLGKASPADISPNTPRADEANF